MIEVAFGTLWGGRVVVGAILLLSSWTSPTLLSMLNLILQPVWCFVNKGRKLKRKKRYLADWPLSLLATNLRVKEEEKKPNFVTGFLKIRTMDNPPAIGGPQKQVWTW